VGFWDYKPAYTVTGGPFLHQWKDVNELEAAVHDFYVKKLLNLRILQTILI
jgi:hypothetical protein